MARDRYFKSRVVEIQELCAPVRHLVLQREDDVPVHFTAGQFIMIHFQGPDGAELNRSYSMADPPSEDGATFALCVKEVEGGLGSTLIHRLAAGDTITTSGPYGRFVLGSSLPKTILLVATGTGVAPFRAMVPQLKALMDEGHTVWLLLGVRYTEELLYHDAWQALEQARPAQFHYRPVVSRPDESWQGAHGYVSEFINELDTAVEPEHAIAYLCGVPEMINSMKALLLERGFTRRTVKTEKYTSPPPPGKKITFPQGKGSG